MSGFFLFLPSKDRPPSISPASFSFSGLIKREWKERNSLDFLSELLSQIPTAFPSVRLFCPVLPQRPGLCQRVTTPSFPSFSPLSENARWKCQLGSLLPILDQGWKWPISEFSLPFSQKSHTGSFLLSFCIGTISCNTHSCTFTHHLFSPAILFCSIFVPFPSCLSLFFQLWVSPAASPL